MLECVLSCHCCFFCAASLERGAQTHWAEIRETEARTLPLAGRTPQLAAEEHARGAGPQATHLGNQTCVICPTRCCYCGNRRTLCRMRFGDLWAFFASPAIVLAVFTQQRDPQPRYSPVHRLNFETCDNSGYMYSLYLMDFTLQCVFLCFM